MKRTRIKICGFKDVGLAMAAVYAGADAIGLNFVAKSPRVVTVEQAKIIRKALPAFVEPVGLFCDASAEQIIAIAKEIGLATIQLHGKESVSYANYLSPLRIIKALPFDDGFADQIEHWASDCENLAGILVDAPPKDGLTGGTGVAIDWGKLAAMKKPHWPALILAGGLTPGNVCNAIATVKPYGVDVASGVEIERGIKDENLIQQFCAAVFDVK